MIKRLNNWILYLIIAAIAITIGIQLYFNYHNYQQNKQQLINEVQLTLDDAVEKYYADIAHESTFALTLDQTDSLPIKLLNSDSLFHNHPDFSRNINQIQQLIDSTDNFLFQGEMDIDTLFKSLHLSSETVNDKFKRMTFIESRRDNLPQFETLTSRIMISLTSDSLNLTKVDSIFKNALNDKNIDVDASLLLEEPTTEVSKRIEVTSSSPYLPPYISLKARFTNATFEILKRGLAGILISTALIATVLLCFLYLLNVIKKQKQLAEVKNDLISNITHEFKTPIATIGVALESIKDFKALDDKVKTDNYLSISETQLGKLNTMVEKLLETATLDSDNLILKKELVDLSELVNNAVVRKQLSTSKNFVTNIEDKVTANLDRFHFENAVNNILDNAINYGGDIIEVSLASKHIYAQLEISDNGGGITSLQKEQLFDKFYRIPKGNNHDVKGFGIGLYYTKSIVEKHEGTIAVDCRKDQTTFTINIPK